MSTTPPPAITKGGVVTYLSIDGARKAAEFYKTAFDAEEAFAMPEDDKGRTMHIHLHINGQSIMLSDFYPEHGHAVKPHSGFTLCFMLESGIEARFQKAVDAGCTVTQPVQKMFWGDVYGALDDPFGVSWAMNQGA